VKRSFGRSVADLMSRWLSPFTQIRPPMERTYSAALRSTSIASMMPPSCSILQPGTAAWNFVAISQHILGVKPELGGLRVNPCIGGSVPSFTIVRKCRGATYQITVDNRSRGKPARLKVNGQAHAGTVVPYAAAGETVVIECEI